MHVLPLLLLTFLGVVFGLAAVYSLVANWWLRAHSDVSKRVDAEFKKQRPDATRKTALFKDLHRLATDAAPPGETPKGLWARFTLMVEQSGLHLAPRSWLILAGAVGLAAGTVAGLIRHTLFIAMPVALVASLVPLLYVWLRARARQEKFRSQLPDAFETMSRALRAGQTLPQSLQLVARTFRPPLNLAFAVCFEQQNLGLPAEAAFRELAERSQLLELKLFVLATVVQQQTGGNLAELLDKLATLLRERFRMRGKISALTAEGRMQAIVLLALPPLMFLVLLVLRPAYAQVLLDHPNLLVATLVFQLIGAFWIHKIVHFDF